MARRTTRTGRGFGGGCEPGRGHRRARCPARLQRVVSSPAIQTRYLDRQSRLLDSARSVALFQLTFADLDLSAVTLPPGSILPLFAHLGVVDSAFGTKPALAAWDRMLAAPYAP